MKTPRINRLHIYGSVASIAGVIAALVTFWLTQASASRDLSLKILSEGLLLTEPLKGDLQLFYKQKAVENVVTFLVEVKNSGRQPILPADFDGPIELLVENVQRIISVEQIISDPTGILFTTDVQGDRVFLRPLLLNPEDTIVFAVKATLSIMSQPQMKIANARIAGIKKVSLATRVPQNSKRRDYLTALFAGLLVSMAPLVQRALVRFVERLLDVQRGANKSDDRSDSNGRSQGARSE